ncbi:MAG TPA: EamA family transporter [Acidimicrobiales bacterium]|nr:EamA family transporter [Acidimicrobiales bacterium]
MARTRPASRRGRAPAPAGLLVIGSAVSVQIGAAIAIHLFHRISAAGAVTLRLVFAAALLVAFVHPRLGGRLRRRPERLGAAAERPAPGRRDLAVAVTFGVVLAAMNLSFYESLARVPLGVAVTVEFAGPLAVTIAGSRRRLDLLWAVLAGAGVFLLAGGGLFSAHQPDLVGLGLALLAGAFWAAYIVLSKQTGQRFPGSSGLAVAMVVAAVCILPVGLASAGGRLFAPGVLGMGVGVALLSSALPYSLEMAALRRVSARAFGILVSIDPAVATVAGLAVLGQHLTATAAGAVVLVVAANVGSSWADARPLPVVEVPTG